MRERSQMQNIEPVKFLKGYIERTEDSMDPDDVDMTTDVPQFTVDEREVVLKQPPYGLWLLNSSALVGCLQGYRKPWMH